MAVTEFEGTVFEPPAQVVVNTVNCVGAMGKGLALVFKQRYPEMYLAYKNLCNQGKLRPGKLWLYRGDELPGTQWVLNFPTKDHYRDLSDIEYIKMGLSTLAENYMKMGIESINIPPLGCSNGGLDFDTVKALVYGYLDGCQLQVNFCTNVYGVGEPEKTA